MRRPPHIGLLGRVEADLNARPSSTSRPSSATPSVPQTLHTPLNSHLSAFKQWFKPSIRPPHPAQAHGWSPTSPPESGVRIIKIDIESEFYLKGRGIANTRDALQVQTSSRLIMSDICGRLLRRGDVSGFMTVIIMENGVLSRSLALAQCMNHVSYFYCQHFLDAEFARAFVAKNSPGRLGVTSITYSLSMSSLQTMERCCSELKYLERHYSNTESASCATNIHISFQPPDVSRWKTSGADCTCDFTLRNRLRSSDTSRP